MFMSPKTGKTHEYVIVNIHKDKYDMLNKFVDGCQVPSKAYLINNILREWLETQEYKEQRKKVRPLDPPTSLFSSER